MKLEVLSGSHNRMEKGTLANYSKGEVFEGTERELKAFAGKLGRVVAPVDPNPQEPEGQPEGEPEQDKKPKGKGKGGKGGAK